MLNLRPANVLFSLTLVLGMLIAISSSSWMITWMGLELNLMSFIPIVSSSINIYKTEATLKYFLIQALASSMIILGAMYTYLSQAMPLLLISSALMLKAGAAPLHFWILPVMQGMSWNACLVLMTVQKVAPLALVSYSSVSPASQLVIQISSMLSALVGALGGLNQTLLRKLMAYSSISHMGWILSSTHLSSFIWVQYMVVYSLVSASVIFLFKSYQMFHLKQILSIPGPWEKLSLFTSIFSLGGLPPFLGFYPKLLLLTSLTNSLNFAWLGILLTSSLLTLFYYARLVTTSFTLSNLKNKGMSNWCLNIPMSIYVFSALNFALLLAPLIFNT